MTWSFDCVNHPKWWDCREIDRSAVQIFIELRAVGVIALLCETRELE